MGSTDLTSAGGLVSWGAGAAAGGSAGRAPCGCAPSWACTDAVPAIVTPAQTEIARAPGAPKPLAANAPIHDTFRRARQSPARPKAAISSNRPTGARVGYIAAMN